MKLKLGFEAEYKKRHDEIWPELQKLLKDVGISGYHIFLEEETSPLFVVQKLSGNSTEAQLPAHPVMKKWWNYMADIMEIQTDNSPVSIPLQEVFYME